MNRVKAEIVYEPEDDQLPRELPVTMYQAYLLHSKADRMLRALVAKQLEGLQLTMMEWLLLGVVSEGPEDGISLSDIAKQLDVSQPQVTALMANVSKLKLVRQKVQRQDRRSRHVILSSRGKRLLSQTEEAITEKMQEWLTNIPEKQLSAYIDTIRHISEQEP